MHVRKATRAEPDQNAIYDALGIDPAPGGGKMIVWFNRWFQREVPLARFCLCNLLIISVQSEALLKMG